MSYGEPIGYVYEGAIYCENCIGDDVRDDPDTTGAIFDDSESDSPEHCGQCGEFLGGYLTTDGWDELVKRIRNYEFEFWPDLLDEYMRHWSGHDWYVIPTFEGMMDPTGNLKDW